jgi:hypothetical protein
VKDAESPVPKSGKRSDTSSASRRNAQPLSQSRPSKRQQRQTRDVDGEARTARVPLQICDTLAQESKAAVPSNNAARTLLCSR